MSSGERFISKLLNLGDLKSDVIDPAFPKELKKEDNAHGGITDKFLDIVAHKFELVKASSESLENLLDPDKVRVDFLDKLGRSFSVLIDETESEAFQRTLIKRATGLFAIKGSRLSYQVRGRASGFDVSVFNYYQVDHQYLQFLEDDEIQEIPPGSFQQGKYFTTVEPGSRPGIPETDQCGYCFTSFIKLKFVLLRLPPEDTVGDFLDKVILKIKEVVAAHVRDVFFDLDVFMRADIITRGTMKTEETLKMKGFMWSYFDTFGNDDFYPLGRDPFIRVEKQVENL